MNKGKELRSRILSQAPYFDYLSDKDRCLLAVDRPTHRFNVIGTGNNGREHIRVTLLEGRAIVHGVYDPNERSAAEAQTVYNRSRSSPTKTMCAPPQPLHVRPTFT